MYNFLFANSFSDIFIHQTLIFMFLLKRILIVCRKKEMIGTGDGWRRDFIVIKCHKMLSFVIQGKDNENTDFREMAKLKTKIQLINEGRFVFRGRLL